MRRPVLRISCAGLLAIALVAAASAYAAPEPKGQKGLPPELVIPEEPTPAEQAKLLRTIIDSAKPEQRPGGLLAGLKNMFAGKPREVVIAASDLWKYAEELRTAQIVVHGVVQPEDGKLSFATSEGPIPLDFGAGVEPEGFPTDDLTWCPAVTKAIVELPFGKPHLRVYGMEPSVPLASLRLARVLEVQGQYRQAMEAYGRASKELQRARLPWAAFAATQAGWIAYHRLREPKMAQRHLYAAWSAYAIPQAAGRPVFDTWVLQPDGKSWKRVPVAEAVGPLLDSVGRQSFWYGLVDFFVRLAGGNAALGVVLLALATRLLIHPLTRKQLASMEAMRRLQPEIKALQEEYKDDKQKFQEELLKLWRENNVNPFGGCWPMLIQMPILIFVYQGIRKYIFQFSQSRFLWVRNLALPDLPLLVAYTISMVFFQQMANRMQAMPADEKQRQQQQMMTWMMPLMFFFFFRTLPSAFILYWLTSNLFYFAEQWLFRRQVVGEELEAPETGGPPKRRGFLDALSSAASRRADTPTDKASSGPTPAKSQSRGKPGKRTSKKRSKKKK